ncbi:MAG: SAM-dependent methyltransferase [Pseudomonadota bacterium]
MTALIRRRIAQDGPLPISDFMSLALSHPQHGYYPARDPLGAAGDFTTAPEVHQMFGEVLGLWLAERWQAMGAPRRVVLAELGPGRGTLMADALRAVAVAAPGLHAAAELWLVETSPALRARQARALSAAAPRWADRVEDLPPGPLLCLANEFFDALPIRQALRVGGRWRERCVGMGEDGALVFGLGRVLPLDIDASEGAMREECPAAQAVMRLSAERIAAKGGALLALDYGYEAAPREGGDTLQALRRHAYADPLASPGEADLTAHVDFGALSRAAEAAGAQARLATQGAFLERLGITARAQALARAAAARGEEAEAVVAAHRRLTHPAEMGTLFKAFAVTPRGAPAPPGFA